MKCNLSAQRRALLPVSPYIPAPYIGSVAPSALIIPTSVTNVAKYFLPSSVIFLTHSPPSMFPPHRQDPRYHMITPCIDHGAVVGSSCFALRYQLGYSCPPHLSLHYQKSRYCSTLRSYRIVIVYAAGVAGCCSDIGFATQCWYFCWNLKYVPELGLAARCSSPPQVVNKPAVPQFVECDRDPELCLAKCSRGIRL